ncbi:hypothetical protein Daus18300_010318 [Diaporthe australafricana]|uniref:Heterokaryon incompatibility domain-containing protein n=1 Tax=Diaporthe australafricana TaxID=127596 RepID=A0ABR3WB02_9PEZI
MLGIHGPGDSPLQASAQRISVRIDPSSFYETITSWFPAFSKVAGIDAKNSPQIYEYKPLTESRNIRVLQLWPGTGNTQIRCDTQVITLGEGFQYEALSYTWGDQSTGALITFNGVLLPIAHNLCTTLLHLRLLDRPRMLWVDAVCINQLDHEEKSVQVRLMRDIYQDASEVVVWLGPEEDDSNMAMDFLTGDVTAGCREAEVPLDFEYFPDSDIAPASTHPEHGAGTEDEGKIRAQIMDSRVVQSRPDTRIKHPSRPITEESETDRTWAAVFALVKRPWWTRVWIVQECVLPKRDPTVQCGHRTVSWKDFEKLKMVNIDGTSDPDSFPVSTRSAVRIMYRISGLLLARQSFHENTTMDLKLLLQYDTLNSEATNPKDKVYGLLGLTSEDCRASLLPDYSKSVTDVYMDTARYIINSTGSLNILSTNTNSRRVEEPPLPSWVPDWCLRASRPRALLCSGIYSASRSYRANITTGPDPYILELKGLPVDLISDVSPVIHHQDALGPSLHGTIRRLYELVRAAITRRVHNGRTLLDVHLIQRTLAMDPDPRNSDQFWRTLVADSHRLPSMTFVSPAPDHFAELFELFMFPPDDADPLPRRIVDPNSFDNVRIDWPRLTTSAASTVPVNFMPLSGQALRREKYLEPLKAEIARVLGERRLFVTKAGRLGIGPPECRPGDIVSVLLGAEMPFLLRGQDRSDGALRLIGESYVHGVMHGEAMLMFPGPDEGFEQHMVTFKLC